MKAKVEVELNGVSGKEELELTELSSELDTLLKDLDENDSVHITIKVGKQTRRLRPLLQQQITTQAREKDVRHSYDSHRSEGAQSMGVQYGIVGHSSK